MKQLVCVILAMLFTVNSGAVEIYKCKDGKGQWVFSQERCGEDAQTLELEIHTTPTPTESDSKEVQTLLERDEALSRVLKKRRYETQLKNLEDKRGLLVLEHERELAELKEELEDASGWGESEAIRVTIRTIKQNYWADLQQMDNRIWEAKKTLLHCCNER